MKKSAKEQPNKLAKKIVRDNENGARRAILEDLFFDFHKSRHQVYWVNFVRGIFFANLFGCSLADFFTLFYLFL